MSTYTQIHYLFQWPSTTLILVNQCAVTRYSQQLVMCTHVFCCCWTQSTVCSSLSLLPPENGFHEGPWSWQQLSYHLTDRQGWGWGWTGTRHWCRVCGWGWVATERLTETSKRNVSTFIKGGNNMLEKKWTEGERRRLRQNRPSLRMMWVECSCSFWHV